MMISPSGPVLDRVNALRISQPLSGTQPPTKNNIGKFLHNFGIYSRSRPAKFCTPSILLLLHPFFPHVEPVPSLSRSSLSIYLRLHFCGRRIMQSCFASLCVG